MRKSLIFAVAAAGILGFGGPCAWGADSSQPGLAKALAEAAVPLEQRLKASEREGKPISGKYELEGGAIQLSVYIMKGDSFNEVIVDHKSGAIIKSEPVEADDLQQAKEQAQALTHAKVSLETAISEAIKNHSGYRAVGVVPTVDRAGKPVASITLMKGNEVTMVTGTLE
jgi:hypothetical protein